MSNKKLTRKKNKKALSEMVGYVLLVVIAISLSIGVYAWLKFIIGGIDDTEKCPGGVSLVIQDYECLDKEIQLDVKNKGRFSVYGYTIRGTDNKSQESWFNLKDVTSIGGGEEGIYLLLNPLQPNENDTHSFSYEGLEKLEKIEIEPFRLQKKESGVKKEEIVYCENAVVNQEVDCS